MQNFHPNVVHGHHSDARADFVPDTRPVKVARTEKYRDRGAYASDSGNLGADITADQEGKRSGDIAYQPIRTRGITACQTCRSRKTKCDSRRPACGYCVRVDVKCTYLEVDQTPTPELSNVRCHFVAPQLLEAISNLTNLIRREQTQKFYQQSFDGFSPVSIPFIETGFSPRGHADDPHTRQIANYLAHQRHPRDDTSTLIRTRGSNRTGIEEQRMISHEGLQSVLDWDIFPLPKPLSISLADSDINVPSTNAIPNFHFSELTRLKTKYIAAVHVKNPILNLQRLHEMVVEVAENGLDWSTRTCLIAIVCALGAQCQRYSNPETTPKFSQSHESMQRTISDDGPELAFQYWSVAVKRLGFALEQNNLEAVQCLCLAGVWYMQNLRPLQAWKYFSFAGNAWYSATSKRQPSPTIVSDGPNGFHALTLEQSLYFTTYKSECELRVELAIPGSILEDVDLSYDFPLPPNIPNNLTDSDSYDTERGWYYYLAEIASRHLINRILRTRSRMTNQPTTKEISHMLSELDIFESQLSEWHTSLPPIIAFPVPEGPSVTYLPEELLQLLRSRYMTIRELIYRPFVRLCVNNTVIASPELTTKVVSIASQGLQYCMYRLQVVNPHRHHGLWFALRSTITLSLVLIGADRASRDPVLNAASEIVLPQGWKEQIRRTQDLLAPYWKERRGGIYECSRILEWALAGCPFQHFDQADS